MGSSHFKVKNTHKKQATAASKRRLEVEAEAGEHEVEVEAGERQAEVEVESGRSEVEVEVEARVVKRAETAQPSDACLSGSFYTSPTIGSSHPVLHTPLLISWDPALACLPGPQVDVYLYAPHSAMPRIHLWKGVNVKEGKVEVELMPRWWNATRSEELQIQIVQQNTPPFLSPLPAGPVFTATYDPPADGSLPLEADTSVVDIGETDLSALSKAQQSSNKGRIAAGVVIPLLLIALAVGAYVRWKRMKGVKDRKKWTEAVDKRMSTISVDWKSVTHVGAQEAIRKSFAANRASTFSFNGGGGSGEMEGEGGGVEREQRRPGVGLRNPSGLSNGERVSRVSFANDPRPSSESRRTKAFRDSYVPPVPSLPPVTTSTSPLASSALAYNPEDSNDGGAMSPTQTEGAFSLTPEAIRARIAAGRARSASNASKSAVGGEEGDDIGDIGPALSMMRTGHNPAAAASSDDLLFAVPATPQPAYASPLAAQSFSSPMASSFNTTAPLNIQHASSFSSAQANTAYGQGAYDAYGQGNAYDAAYGGTQAYGGGHASNYSSGQGIASPTTVSSPVMASIPMPAMQAMPAAVMSPDDMLRAYAERKKSMSAAPSTGISSSASSLSQGGAAAGIAYPQPAAGTGRTLFSGSTVSPQGTGERKERTPSLGFAPGEYDPDFRFEK